MGTINNPRARANPMAPPTWMRPSRPPESAGIFTHTNTKANNPRPAVNANTDRHSQTMSRTPASVTPKPLPIPSVALNNDVAPGTRWFGRTRRAMPMLSGTELFAAPCNTRPTSMTPRFGATAQIREPTVNDAMAPNSVRLGPKTSPSRPMTGVRTAPARELTNTIHVALPAEIPNSSGNRGRTGMARL